MAEETHVGETEDDMEAYELSDFNVQVISASESEDEPIRDLNPDLELLCESDQEGKDEGEIDSSSGLNNMDLKIVQIDFEAPDEPSAPMSTDAVEKGRFDCSECGGWYSSISSLHIHRRWHDAQKRRQQTEGLTQTVNVEKEKIACPEPSGQQKNEASDDTIVNLSQQVDKHNSGPVKPKYHTCPICLMTFAKARGLRKHNWQVHSMDKESTKEVSSMIKTECNFSDRDVNDTESQAFETALATVKHVPVDEQKSEVKPFGKPFSCFDCGKDCRCPGALLDNEKLCLAVEQDSKLDCQMSEASTQVSPPLSHVLDITDKCLFKCKKCGKAFPTEEQLRTHKDKAKSRPFSCALCCHTASLPSSSQLISQSASTSQSSQHCGKAFLSPGALQRHNTQLGSSVLYSCPFCPMTFNEIQELIVHHQECVGGDKRHAVFLAAVPSECTNEFTCYECGTTFCQETDLHQHCCDHAHQAHYTKPLKSQDSLKQVFTALYKATRVNCT
uniref:C2H2-type domain-containing protein n=1 Tax=Gouania willdenowi TaxID=441366 RepID=A0A8C5G443_GOUWI